MKYVLFLIFSVTGLVVWSETKPLEQYLDGIVKPCPFGQVPEDFDPTVDPTSRAAIGGVGATGAEEVPLSEQQQALQQVVNATVIHIDPTTRVPWLGFTDATNGKSPRTHFVAEGASEDGWTVKEIDLVKKTAKLAKGEVEIDVVVGAPPPPRAGGRGAAQGGAARGVQASSAPQPGAMSGMRSLREAHREQAAAQLQQLEASRQAMDEARRRQEEMEARQEQDKAEREAQQAQQREELKSLAERLERRMAEARQQKVAEEESADE